MLTRSTAGFRAARVATEAAARFAASGDLPTASRWAHLAARAAHAAHLDREADR